MTMPGQLLQLKSEPKWYPRGGARRIGSSLRFFQSRMVGLPLVVAGLHDGGCTLVLHAQQG